MGMWSTADQPYKKQLPYDHIWPMIFEECVQIVMYMMPKDDFLRF